MSLRQILFYAVAGGVLIALLKLLDYHYFVHAYPGEIYGGLLALIFSGIGIFVGLKSTVARREVVVKEVRVKDEGPFVLHEETLAEIGLTPREHEILELIAEGLSNREIAHRLFVSENTVKTHSSRLFHKLEVNRRTQAIQKGRHLGLIP